MKNKTSRISRAQSMLAKAHDAHLQRRIAEMRANRENNPNHPLNVLRRHNDAAIAKGALVFVEMPAPHVSA
jgi:hypothetical protein